MPNPNKNGRCNDSWYSNLLNLEWYSKNSHYNFIKLSCNRRTVTCISFAIIPLAILLSYGIEDKTAWFFGHDFIDDYRYRVSNNVVYHLGVMVSHYSLILTLSIVGMLIGWIIYEGWKLLNISITRYQFLSISSLAVKTLTFCSNVFLSNPMKSKSSHGRHFSRSLPQLGENIIGWIE
jgi:hypothetical protein